MSREKGIEKMEKPVVLQVGPYPRWDQEPLDAAFRVYRYYESADKAALLAEVGLTIKAITTRGELGAQQGHDRSLPQSIDFPVYGVGFDAVFDLQTCRERGIRVTSRRVLTNDVTDLGIAMMLCNQARHAWRRNMGA